MEKEISSGAMLGIVLIALAAIIGLGFGVFAIAKGTANEGVTGVQDGLQTVGDSAYTDFDQKIVTGTQLMSSYNNFQGKNVAILVATQATKDKAAESKINEGSGVAQAYASVGAKTAGVKAYADNKKAAAYKMEGLVSGVKTAIGTGNAAFINYNALIKGTVTADGSTYADGGVIYFDNNCFRTTEGYATSAGKVEFNNISGNMNKSGMMEYVASGAKFQSYLLKDASGTTMGVVFEQIGGK